MKLIVLVWCIVVLCILSSTVDGKRKRGNHGKGPKERWGSHRGRPTPPSQRVTRPHTTSPRSTASWRQPETFAGGIGEQARNFIRVGSSIYRNSVSRVKHDGKLDRSEKGKKKHHGRRGSKSKGSKSSEDSSGSWGWNWNNKNWKSESEEMVTTPRPIWRWTTWQPFWKRRGWSSESSDSDESDIWNWSGGWDLSDSSDDRSEDSDEWWSSKSESSESKSRRGSKESHSHSRSKESKRGSKKSKHSRGSKGSHSHSKESGSKSRESSESQEGSSSEGSGSSEERVTPEWCEIWCVRWASHFKNFHKLFANSGARFFWQRDRIVRHYCTALIAQSGDICNYHNGTTTSPEPTELPRETTTDIYITSTTDLPRMCLSYRDCEEDECCTVTEWNPTVYDRTQYRSVRRPPQGRCTKNGKVGDSCFTDYRQRMRAGLYSSQCPCGEGLQCDLARLAERGVCYNPRVTTGTTEDWRRRTTDPTGKPRRTTTDSRGSTLVSRTIPTTTAEPNFNATETNTNSTEPLPLPCSSVMDCPLLHCCASTRTENDDPAGVCTPLSDEGEYCSRLETFKKREVIAACPCQSFLQCKRAENPENDAYGICL